MSDLQKLIDDGLAKFRNERGIENDCGDLVGNLKAELQEAIEAADSVHKAEEFADIYIIAANAVVQCGFDCGDKYYENSATPRTITMCVDYINHDVRFIELGSGVGDSIHCIMRDAKLAIKFIGYNPESVILEKCKLINTRTGKMNEAGTKWEKDVNQNPETLYKPDYESCKI